MKDNDKQLIWEAYNSRTGKSIQEGEEHWDRMRRTDPEKEAEYKRKLFGGGPDEEAAYRARQAAETVAYRKRLAQKGQEDPAGKVSRTPNALKAREERRQKGKTSTEYQDTGARPDDTLGEGPIDSEASGHYVEWLKKHSTEKGEWGPIGMEGVISHPFEETYAEYVNQSGLTDPYRAAQAHMKIAETGDNEGYKFYHEVDLQSLENWKYHGKDEVHGGSDEDDPKRDGPGYDPDGNPVDDRDDAEDSPGEGFEKEDDDDEEKPGPHADRAKKAGKDFGKSGGKMFVQHGDEDDDGDDDDGDDDDVVEDSLVDIYKKTLEGEERD